MAMDEKSLIVCLGSAILHQDADLIITLSQELAKASEDTIKLAWAKLQELLSPSQIEWFKQVLQGKYPTTIEPIQVESIVELQPQMISNASPDEPSDASILNSAKFKEEILLIPLEAVVRHGIRASLLVEYLNTQDEVSVYRLAGSAPAIAFSKLKSLVLGFFLWKSREEAKAAMVDLASVTKQFNL